MSVSTHRRCQLTIIAEYVLEEKLIALVGRMARMATPSMRCAAAVSPLMGSGDARVPEKPIAP